MGAASRENYSATLPPDRFHCLLDDLPLHLMPRAMQEIATGDGRNLVLSPDCRLYRSPEVPEELASQPDLLSAFALQGTIAWVRDTATSSLLPFWLGPKFESVLQNVKPNEYIAHSLPASIKSVLQRAGILVSANSTDEGSVARKAGLQRAAELFQSKGYAPISGLIHPFHIAALRRYYRYRIRTGQVPLGDGQSARRYVSYNDPVARFFHQQIASTLSAVAGEPVKPSYVYLASYLSGAELKKHVDREQCEFSITFCLDFSPEPTLATPWPICLDTSAGRVTVYQTVGDGLAYRGTRLPHYRSKLSEGQTSTSIFFHYVAADFAGSLS